MKITILIAGTNSPSNCAMLAEHFASGTRSANSEITIETIELSKLSIDHFTVNHYRSDFSHEADFQTLQAAITSSDGLVIATPVWNFGVPAHLKNAIDRMGSFALDETKSKGALGGLPLFTIFTGGAPDPAWYGMMKSTTSFVQEGLRYFGATPVGSYFEGKCTKGVGQFGLVVDQRPDSLQKVRAKGEQFAEVVSNFSKDGSLPLTQNIWSKCMKAGEKLMKKVF